MPTAMGTPWLLAASADKADAVSAPEAALLGAGIAALAALLTTGLNALIQRALATRSERETASRLRADRITEQLSQLYGPLLLLTVQGRALAEKLREGKSDPDEWRLLDHLTEVVADPADRAIAEQIIAVNAEVESRILTHAGLLKDGDLHDSFGRFLGHNRFLTISFDAAKANKQIPREFTAKQFDTYPRALDDHVKTVYEELQRERNELLKD